jgi:hypothetical protein
MKTKTKKEAIINQIAQGLFISFKENDIKIAGKKNVELIDLIAMVIDVEKIDKRVLPAFEDAILMYYNDKINKVLKLKIKKEYKEAIIDTLNFKLECDIDSLYILNADAIEKQAA